MGSVIGHCMLVEEDGRLLLVDAGIGLQETIEPDSQLRKRLMETSNFRFDEELVAINQIEKLGYRPDQIKDCIVSHLDPDHIGGLADIKNAKVHVSKEEYDSFQNGDKRYVTQQLAHDPQIELYGVNDSEWFGLPARRLDVDLRAEFFFIPLFGHTRGHCGVAFKKDDRWIFYVGDAYLLRAEVNDVNHPVSELAARRAVDNRLRIESLEKIRKVVNEHESEIEYFGYHDPSEFI